VHLLDRGLRRGIVREGDKSESSGATSVALQYYLCVFNFPKALKCAAEPRVVGVPTEASYEESSSHAAFCS
jgi:hypothetical protein